MFFFTYQIVEATNLTIPVKTVKINDLLPLMTTDRAIMKVDVQGHEIAALSEEAVGKFLDTIHVPVLLAEWHFYPTYWPDKALHARVDNWLKVFTKRNYTIHS